MVDNLIHIDKKFIPLDKSWIIRMGVLDIINGYDDIAKFLSDQKNLGDDLVALKRVAGAWKSDVNVDIGESGTLYRLLKFTSWKLNLNKVFIKQGTLIGRNICDDSKIVNLSQTELLKLDNNTSQWASAAILLGDTERLHNVPFKLKLTYEAVDYWRTRRQLGLSWEAKYDQTILDQAQAYLKILGGQNVNFIPKQAEDFCFAYIFGYITSEEGEKLWPALRGHESDRIIEVENTLKIAKDGGEIISKDHRVIQAIAMWGRVNNKKVHVLYPQAVNKSWPQFWDFLNA